MISDFYEDLLFRDNASHPMFQMLNTWKDTKGTVHVSVNQVYSDYELINGQWTELPPF
jgi:hypothetical protein